MNIVFCTDRRMLAGLHVAAQSVLTGLSESSGSIAISLFSADLDESDADLLRKTLNSIGKAYSLHLYSIDGGRFEGFPELQASFATYFRLVVPEILDVDRFLYIDVDILCRTDLRRLYHTKLNGHAIGLVPEAPIHQSADPGVAKLLGDFAHGHYFNAGVMLVDAVAWRRKNLTNCCIEFIQKHKPRYHDQSALNFVLHGDIHSLEEQYNCRTNARENWPTLRPPQSGSGSLLHFVDFPKPWSPLGRWLHPMGKLWWTLYEQSEHSKCKHRIVAIGRFVGRCAIDRCHRKMLKDRLLFSGYCSGILKNVKGVPQ